VGLGFFLMKRGGVTLVGHTGEQAGYRSFFYFNPVTRAGVIGVVTTINEARPMQSGPAFRAALQAAARVIAP
jgi:CubicO group peptidase (beta-lactamase class C family)